MGKVHMYNCFAPMRNTKHSFDLEAKKPIKPFLYLLLDLDEYLLPSAKERTA